MTQGQKLNILNVMVGGNNTDELLSAYLIIAGKKIIARAYPYRSDVEEVPPQYEYLQCEIAAYLINKRGAEGQTSHTENGITRQYENADVPSSMLKSIIPYCEVVR